MTTSDSLLRWFQPFRSCVVAFSGGLDSTVVAKAASLALGERAVAVMAESATSCRDEVRDARAVAETLPIRLIVFSSTELDDPAFVANGPDRCYHCKRIRLGAVARYATEHGFDVVLDGSNADDLDDFRPGRRAVDELGLRSPLAEFGLDKSAVRELARFWNLPNSEKPASPCLVTRLAYGLAVTPERLRTVEAAETFLRERGFSPVRVRLHPNKLARIEVAIEQLGRLAALETRTEIIETLRRLGFDFVSVDLEGFRSGSMNRGIGN